MYSPNADAVERVKASLRGTLATLQLQHLAAARAHVAHTGAAGHRWLRLVVGQGVASSSAMYDCEVSIIRDGP
jgi:hypothetical protein